DGVGLDARDRAHVDHQLVAEALDPTRDAHDVAALEAPRKQIGVAERARRDGARAVAQLERQIRRPGPRDEAVLARAGEDAGHVLALTQSGYRGDGGHQPMMYRDPDAAPRVGPPAGRAPGPGSRVRVQGLERRR